MKGTPIPIRKTDPREVAKDGIEPMLAKSVSTVPREGHIYEPKWDGFRCLVYRKDDWITLRSRNNKSLDPAIDDPVREEIGSLPGESLILDGELLAMTDDGGFSFRSVASLRRGPGPGSPSLPVLVLFDLLLIDDIDLRDHPLEARKTLLDELTADISLPLFRSPTTSDYSQAAVWLERSFGRGIDGLIAKDPSGTYRPGVRAWKKFRWIRSADCVVAGVRWSRGDVVSLLLGLYDDDGGLHYVGALSNFTEKDRRGLTAKMAELILIREDDHPWLEGNSRSRIESAGKKWVPLAPKLVCEVDFDLVEDGRFRHPPKFVRWRTDKDPESCSIEQLTVAGPLTPSPA